MRWNGKRRGTAALALAVAAAGPAVLGAGTARAAGSGYSISVSQFGTAPWQPLVIAGGRYSTTVTVTAAAATTVRIQAGGTANPNPGGVVTTATSGACTAGTAPFLLSCDVPAGKSAIVLSTAVAASVPDGADFSLGAAFPPGIGGYDSAGATVLTDVGGASALGAISGPGSAAPGRSLTFSVHLHAPIDGDFDWDFPGSGDRVQIVRVSSSTGAPCSVSGTGSTPHWFGCTVRAGDGDFWVTANVSANAPDSSAIVSASYIPRHVAQGRQPESVNVVKSLAAGSGGSGGSGSSGGSGGSSPTATPASGAGSTTPPTAPVTGPVPTTTAPTGGDAPTATATATATSPGAPAATADPQPAAAVSKTRDGGGSGGFALGLAAAAAVLGGGGWLIWSRRARGSRSQ